MDFGAVFPTTEIGNDPGAVREYAQAAEQLGYSSLVAYDHVLGAVHEGREPGLTGPYSEAHPFHEPFVLFGYLAGVTSSITLETQVIILPQRQAVLAAKQAAEVDVLSNGRLRLGLGIGWNYVEYEGLGVPWPARGHRFDEQIELMRRLWTEPVVDFTGRYHRVDRAGIAPRPARSIPIWFGGFSDAALRRAARIGDGFAFAAAGRNAISQVETLRGYVAEAGRNPAEFPIGFTTTYGGTPDKWRETFDRAQAAGITHFSVNSMSSTSAWSRTEPSGCANPAEHIAALERFITALKTLIGTVGVG